MAREPRAAGTGGLVLGVTPGGLAERVGLRPGDRLLAVDGHALRDVIDLQFYGAEERFRLVFQRDGGILETEAARRPGEELGVEFDSVVFGRVRTCNNDCFFCFLKGLPPGLRPSLYLKDDDYRLSFTQGNFVTLSNLTAADWRRLEEQRLSPLNVSVHATERDLRRRLLGNPRAPDIMAQLRRLAEIGVTVDAQVVLCPNVNDGEHLARTVSDLAGLYPAVRSIGVVPVAASRWAEQRMTAAQRQMATPTTPAYAVAAIREARRWQRAFRRRLGVDLVYLADEYYLAAGRPLPAAARYDGFPQYENGIGMTRGLIDDWRRLRRHLRAGRRPAALPRRLTLVCGTLLAPVLRPIAHDLALLTGVDATVVPVENRLFGPRVSVSGLLVAADIVEALRGVDLGDLAVLPRQALDHAGALFLDGGTPDEVAKALGRPLAFASSMSDLLHFSPAAVQ